LAVVTNMLARLLPARVWCRASPGCKMIAPAAVRARAERRLLSAAASNQDPPKSGPISEKLKAMGFLAVFLGVYAYRRYYSPGGNKDSKSLLKKNSQNLRPVLLFTPTSICEDFCRTLRSSDKPGVRERWVGCTLEGPQGQAVNVMLGFEEKTGAASKLVLAKAFVGDTTIDVLPYLK